MDSNAPSLRTHISITSFFIISFEKIYINVNFKLRLSRSSFICCMAKIICQAVNRHLKSAPDVSVINPVIHQACYLRRTRSRPWKRSWVQATQWQYTFLFLYLSFQLFLSGFCLLKEIVFQLISCNRYVNESVCFYASNLPQYKVYTGVLYLMHSCLSRIACLNLWEWWQTCLCLSLSRSSLSLSVEFNMVIPS